MYIDLHTHKINPHENLIAVYSTLPDHFPENHPENWLISAGIHPWLCNKDDFAEACDVFETLPETPGLNWNRDYDLAMRQWLEKLEQLAANNKIIAIGEIGLDRVHNKDLETQNTMFEAQLRIAEKYNLPVIIHCVRAFPEILSLRKTYDKTPWVIHAFRGNVETAGQLIGHDCFLSFGEALLKSHELQMLAKVIPPEFLFLESDQSELNIEELYAGTAQVMSLDLSCLQLYIIKNFKKVFFQQK